MASFTSGNTCAACRAASPAPQRVWGWQLVLCSAAPWASCGQDLQQGKRAGSTGQSDAPPCFKRHLTRAISQLQMEAIVPLVSSLTQQTSSLPPLHTVEAIRALLQASPPRAELRAPGHEAIVRRCLRWSEPKAQRIILLGCPTCSAGSCFGEAAFQAAWNVFLKE